MTKRIYAEAIADRKERHDYFSEPIVCPKCGASSNKLDPRSESIDFVWPLGWSSARAHSYDLAGNDVHWDENSQESSDMVERNMPFGEVVPSEHFVHSVNGTACHRWRVERRASFAAKVCRVFLDLRVDYPLGLVKQYRTYIDHAEKIQNAEKIQMPIHSVAMSILGMAAAEGRKDP